MGLRVLFIHHTAALYGASQSLLLLLDGLKEMGVEGRVVVPEDGSLVAELARRGVYTYVIPFRGWVGPQWNPIKATGRLVLSVFGAMRIWLATRRWMPHVIYTNTSVTAVGALVSLFSHRPHVWHIREFGQEDYGLRFDLGVALSAKIVGAVSVRVVCVSQAVASKYSRWIDGRKTRVIYNPVTLPASNILQTRRDRLQLTREVRLALVGILSRGKGHEDALHAVKVLRDRGIAARVLFVGDGSALYRRTLETLAERLGINESLEFLGYVRDPWANLGTVDAVLMCSRSEAFGRVTAEAMAHGIPVIGARSGGTVELIGNTEERGFFYEPGDAVSLANAVEQLIRRSEEREQKVQRALEWVSVECEPRYLAERVNALLREVVSESQQGKES